MIPTNRPVMGKDLEAVAQQFRMLTSDACWIFGLSITRWTQIVRNSPDDPLTDPTLALLVRFLDDNPDLTLLPQFPTAPEMFEEINRIQQIDQKRFAVMFGNESSATYRWLKPGARMSPAVGRLMYYMRMALLSAPPDKRQKMLEQYRKTVTTEGKARGVSDVFTAGSWNNKAIRDAIAAKKKAEAG